MTVLECYSQKELIIMYLRVLIETKKIVTPELKKQLIAYGFKEIVVGSKPEHKITSRHIKLDFHGFDIAIGLSPIAISYASYRKYFALVFNFTKE